MDFEYEIFDSEVTITGYTDKSVESINIPEFIDNLPVTNIGHSAFCCCTSLKEIIIPNSVTNIGYSAFDNCIHLNEIRIPDSVTNIMDEAFWNCQSLTKIKIPDSMINIGDNAFGRCISLKKISIPNSVITIGKFIFRACYSLTEINNIKLKEGTNLINNRFIYYDGLIYKIRYQIGEDYHCENNNNLLMVNIES